MPQGNGRLAGTGPEAGVLPERFGGRARLRIRDQTDQPLHRNDSRGGVRNVPQAVVGRGVGGSSRWVGPGAPVLGGCTLRKGGLRQLRHQRMEAETGVHRSQLGSARGVVLLVVDDITPSR